MRDVSRLAGVSAMTVSRVLGDPKSASEDTRLRVMQAVEQLGYVPDQVAGSLSSRRTNFVGLILPTLTNSNFADTAEGLAAVLSPAGYQLLIGYTLYQLDEEERLVRSMLSHRPVAIVTSGSHHTLATRQMILQTEVPLVEIWARPDPPIDRSVGFSNFEAGRAAARYLIELGHRRIGALGSDVNATIADHRGEERLQGFSAALHEAGIGDDLVIRHGHAPVTYQHGADALGVLLDRAPDVEAVFAVSDVSAFGVLMECRRRDIDVPGELSILGFGDFEIGRQCAPAISTIHIDAKRIGQLTGEMLVDLLAGEGTRWTARASHDVGFSVMGRETTAPRGRQEKQP
jgi:LacI family gluconate utilization system Gnt-I transcriptional repressor